MAEHPLRRMMDAGLLVTVNSDDPAYFGGYLVENYVAAAEALGLSMKDLADLAEASFTASFLDEPTRLARSREVREYADAHGVR
jgi:adenosine deaminase